MKSADPVTTECHFDIARGETNDGQRGKATIGNQRADAGGWDPAEYRIA